MARRVIIDLDGELFPDVDPSGAPRDLDGWIKHYCGDEGALRLRNLVRKLDQRGYGEAKRGRLHEHFAAAEVRISEEQIDKFLYSKRPRLDSERLALITRYLWEEGLLPDQPRRQRKQPADTIKDLHDGLVGFLDISERALVDLEERFPGRYWIYRASVHDPGQYFKGLLTVYAQSDGSKALSVKEEYRVLGDAIEGQHGFHEVYQGLAVQNSNRPFILSCLRQPTHHGRWPGPRQDADLAVLRITLIAGAKTHSDGKIASMIGLTAANYIDRGVVASPICFERVPQEFPRPEEQLKILSVEQLPSSVRARLSGLVTTHGLTRV